MHDFMAGFVWSAVVVLMAAVPDAGRWVVETIGPERLGRDKVQSTLEGTLAGKVALIPQGDFAIRKRRLRLRGKKARNAGYLAKAARTAGARWLLLVSLAKVTGDPPFTVKARLIDADTGVVSLRFARRYGRGGAGAAAEAIAAEALARISPEAPETSDAPPIPIADREPEPEPEPEIADDPPPDPPPPEPVELAASDPPPPLERIVAPEPEPEPDPEPDAPVSRTALGRVRLGAGSGWIRSVQVTAEAIGDSSLSYRLGPTSLFELGGEFVIPDAGLGVAVDLGLQPVRYAIDTGEGSSRPRGTIFDMFALIIYPFAFGAADAPVLIPGLGAHLSIASVEEHPLDVIPEATALAVVAALSLRIPIGRVLEIEAGGHGGYIPLYRERPTDTGRSRGGFTAGGRFAVRVWLFAGLGLSLDSRLGFDRVAFSERPTRAVPPGEQDLENAALGLLELKSTLAVAYRF